MTAIVTVTIPKLKVFTLRANGFEKDLDRRLRILATKTANNVAREWKAISPIDTGRYRGSLQPRIRMIAGIRQAIVSTNVRSAAGFPYPRALEDSTRYHYRSTARQGQETTGHVAKVARKLTPQVRAESKKTTDEALKAMKV